MKCRVCGKETAREGGIGPKCAKKVLDEKNSIVNEFRAMKKIRLESLDDASERESKMRDLVFTRDDDDDSNSPYETKIMIANSLIKNGDIIPFNKRGENESKQEAIDRHIILSFGRYNPRILFFSGDEFESEINSEHMRNIKNMFIDINDKRDKLEMLSRRLDFANKERLPLEDFLTNEFENLKTLIPKAMEEEGLTEKDLVFLAAFDRSDFSRRIASIILGVKGGPLRGFSKKIKNDSVDTMEYWEKRGEALYSEFNNSEYDSFREFLQDSNYENIYISDRKLTRSSKNKKGGN